MQSRIVRSKQSIMDLALLLTGDVENCVDLFRRNPGIGDFDNLDPGAVITYPDVNNEVTRNYKLNDVSLATAYVSDDNLVLDSMILDINFILQE